MIYYVFLWYDCDIDKIAGKNLLWGVISQIK